MNYSINELITINEVMTKLANAGLTGKIAYLAYRNLSKLAKIADDYNKVRDSLIEKYGTPSEDVEGQIVVERGSDNYPKFIEEITEVLNQTEDITLYKIQEADLDKLADVDLSVSDFAVIDNYLVDRPEKEDDAKDEDVTPVEE